jgi:hypothetical protein
MDLPGQSVGGLVPPYGLLPTISINVLLNETVTGDFPTSFYRFTNHLHEIERVMPRPGAWGLQLSNPPLPATVLLNGTAVYFDPYFTNIRI